MKINFIAPHLVLWSDVGAAVYPAVVLRHIGADPLELAAEITLMRNYFDTQAFIYSFISRISHENPSGESVSILYKNKINL